MTEAQAVPTDEERQRPFIEPGWYRDLSNEEYHGSFGFSSSQLKVLLEKTPAHLKAGMNIVKEPTAAMQLGTAVHTLVLEPEMFDAEFAVIPDLNLRTKAGKEAMAEFEAANIGKALIADSSLEKAKVMAESVQAHPMASALLGDIVPESSIFWWYRPMDPDDDTKYKAMLKVRPDALNPAHGLVIDLKSGIDVSFTGFQKAIQNFYYHVSAAMYLEGVNQCKPLLEESGRFAFTKFVFICVENTPPFATAVYEVPESYLEYGKNLYRKSLRELRHGMENDWPAYPHEIRVIEPPPWANRAHIV